MVARENTGCDPVPVHPFVPDRHFHLHKPVAKISSKQARTASVIIQTRLPRKDELDVQFEGSILEQHVLGTSFSFGTSHKNRLRTSI